MPGPKIFDRVKLDGVNRTFFIIAIDEERQVVTLLPVSGFSPALEDVPISRLRFPPRWSGCGPA